MGYASGQTYTFGATNFLPTLPVVAGWRVCHGGEGDIFNCEAKDVTTDGNRPVQDRDCRNGCVGPDGLEGTADDTIDTTCSHAIDQGAICYDDSSPSQLAVPVCRGCGGGGCALAGNTDQEVIFACIDYYTTQCTCECGATALLLSSSAPATAAAADEGASPCGRRRHRQPHQHLRGHARECVGGHRGFWRGHVPVGDAGVCPLRVGHPGARWLLPWRHQLRRPAGKPRRVHEWRYREHRSVRGA